MLTTPPSMMELSRHWDIEARTQGSQALKSLNFDRLAFDVMRFSHCLSPLRALPDLSP